MPLGGDYTTVQRKRQWIYETEQRRFEIVLRNAGETRNFVGERALRIDERRPFAKNFVAAKFYRADFDDGIAIGLQAGRFEIKRDVDAGHIAILSRIETNASEKAAEIPFRKLQLIALISI